MKRETEKDKKKKKKKSLEETYIEEESNHPYHEEYCKEGIAKK